MAMIQNTLMCIALMAAQIAGQSVCCCQWGEQARHGGMTHTHMHSGSCHAAEGACLVCFGAEQSDHDHHHCHCQTGSHWFLAEHTESNLDEVASIVGLAIPWPSRFFPAAASSFRQGPDRVGGPGMTARARLGIWRL